MSNPVFTQSSWLFEDFDKIFSAFNVDKVFENQSVTKSQIDKQDLGSTITLCLPGHNKETLDIEVKEAELRVKSIKGQLPKGAVHITRNYKFDPNQYDGDNVTAECKDGILTITLPFKKKEDIKSNKIIIK